MKKGYTDLTCFKCSLLIFFALNFSKAFEVKCPSSKEWLLRANSRCLIANGYTCLFDENNKSFRETCKNRRYVDPAGYKFVIVGNLDRRKCESSKYQPFTFSTNGSSTCVFEKSYCSEEGQIVFNNGSTESDRQCRCDYTRGYDFIAKPKNGCYCVPSTEDCSCHQTLCSAGLTLSPDYQCINLTSRNLQFMCELILPYTKPMDTNYPSNDNNLDYSTAAPEMTLRIVRSVMIGVTLTATLLMVQITLFCLPKIESFEDAKKNVLKENMELKSLLAGEVIPQNIRDLQKDVKTQWKKQFSRFLETRASKAFFESMKKQQCVIISGPFGCGKSSLAFHTALKFEETLGFDFMIISNPDDLLKYVSKDKKQVFLIDDAFGKYDVSKYETTWWNLHGESIDIQVTKNINLRLIMTSRLHIYMSVNKPQLKVRFCLFNLISKEIAWTLEEKQMIGRCYLQKDIIDNLSEDVVMSYSFFPKLCAMFNTYSYEQNVEYFTNPVEYLKTDIENFEQSSHNLFYLALVVLVLFDNNVHKDIFNDSNHTYDRLLTSLSKEIGYKGYRLKYLLYSSFIAMTDSYVSDQDTHFACLRSNLFNALASCIGPKIIQNRYFERNLLDMKTALHNIFKGSQHLSAEFRESYIAYMKKHIMKNDLRKDINATTVLHFSSEEGYAEYVEYFLELNKQMVNELDNTGQTALHKTCIKGHISVASLLLNKGAYIDPSDNDSKTPLDIACDCGLIDMVDFLLSRHAKICQKGTDLRSSLHVACDKSNINIANLLLKNNAVVNAQDFEGFTPLHIACEKGFFEIAMMLIDHKANVEIKDIHGKTPLYIACKNGNFKEAELLLFNKARVNTYSVYRNTPIFIACEKKHLDIIKLLLKHNADVNWKNGALITPLHVACQINNIEIASLLIKHGALVNEQDKYLQTALFFACSKGYDIALDDISKNNKDNKVGSEKIVKMLLNMEANVNEIDQDGMTPLHVACKAGQDEIVTMLINAGANLNQMDKNGMTPLHVACKGGHKEIVTMLINTGVNVNKGYINEVKSLHIACMEGHEAIVNVFLNSITNIKVLDKNGMTPLEYARKHGHNDIVTLLSNAYAYGNKGEDNEITT